MRLVEKVKVEHEEKMHMFAEAKKLYDVDKAKQREKERSKLESPDDVEKSFIEKSKKRLHDIWAVGM